MLADLRYAFRTLARNQGSPQQRARIMSVVLIMENHDDCTGNKWQPGARMNAGSGLGTRVPRASRPKTLAQGAEHAGNVVACLQQGLHFVGWEEAEAAAQQKLSFHLAKRSTRSQEMAQIIAEGCSTSP